MHSRKIVVTFFAVFLLAGMVSIAMLKGPLSPVSERGLECEVKLSSDAGGECVKFEIADTPESRQLGLSGRSNLADDEGLLFVFDNPGLHCMWMKDMNFSIDMLWINEQNQVIKIESDVSPDTYPENFCSGSPAKYVIELSAGVARKAGLEVGQELAL